jgi:hypothetical protein
MAFQRKGAPVVADDTSNAADDGDGSDSEGASDASDPNDASASGDQCPNCGCVFDPDTEKVMKPGKPVQGGPDKAGYSPDGKGGPDLALPGVSPDQQAPAGEDAITQALAAVLGGGR